MRHSAFVKFGLSETGAIKQTFSNTYLARFFATLITISLRLVVIDSDNGLVPNMQQMITGTNVYQDL